MPVKLVDLDLRPFRDYAELPVLLDALHAVIGPTAWHGDADTLGILLEPAAAPWCTTWHRDVTAETPGIDPVELEEIRAKLAYTNQVNCALYDDSSTWYVPGSHVRADVASETEHAAKCPTLKWEGVPNSDVDREELEVRCLEYCRAMPRAICLHLGAGDFGLYRPLGWHIGNYVPYRIRATLHDVVWTPEAKGFHERWHQRRAQMTG